MTTDSVIGNVADLKTGQILLPAFVQSRPDGLYVDLLGLETAHIFAQFAERVFAAGARFVELDYELFLNLVFLWEVEDVENVLIDCKRKGRMPQLRIARDIVAFPPARRELYRGLKVDGGSKSAEYLFEQISIEREEEDPTLPGGKRWYSERAYLDFDEFIAALWEKGVRYGIDAKAVREAIARDQAERIGIAAVKAPVAGKDASVDEQTDLLRRDDTPRLLPNGRMDLRHYRNRFPQVNEGTRLFKKVPRVPGRSGWDVQGRELDPPVVNDFDIETMAGPGTRVVRESSGEYVVAAQNGFLDIDAKSGQISVIDKIVSREGVSMRTTGDLSLAGDDYEEHGEVQEKRVVEGHNMTFFADVYGNILSGGGVVTIKRSVASGAVHSPGGTITVEGSASRALLEARNGTIVVERAESCVIVGASVRIGRAVSCDIIGEEVIVEESEGCIVAARNAIVQKAAPRREEPTTVIVLLPDLTPFDDQRKALEAGRADALKKIEKLNAALQEVTQLSEMKTYVAMVPRINSKEVVLNAAQKAQWATLVARVAPHLRKVAAINAEIKGLNEYAAGVDEELTAVDQARKDAAVGIGCGIAAAAGETRAYAMRPAFGETPLENLTPKGLHKRLREMVGGARTLFAGGSGSFDWQAPVE